MNHPAVAFFDQQGFENCIKNPGCEVTATFQILSTSLPNEDFSKYILLSDSKNMKYVFVEPSISIRACKLKSFDIIRAKLKKVSEKPKNKTKILILDYELLTTNMHSIIGNPVDLEIDENSKPHVKKRFLFDNAKERKNETNKDFDDPLQKRCLEIQKEPQKNVFYKLKDIRASDKNFSAKIRVVGNEKTSCVINKENFCYLIKFRDSSGMVKAFLSENVAKKFDPLPTTGKVYEVSGINAVDHTSGSVFGYSIVLMEETVFKEVDEISSIPNDDLSITKLSEINFMKLNTNIDVLSIIVDPGETIFIPVKNGCQKKFRKTKIIDSSGAIVEMAIWGSKADEISIQNGQIYLFKEVKVKEFRGSRNLLFEDSSKIEIPDSNLSDFDMLKTWKDKNKKFIDRVTIDKCILKEKIDIKKEKYLFLSIAALSFNSSIKFKFAKEEMKSQIYETICYIICVSNKISYDSCGFNECRKKVIIVNDKFFCEKCMRIVSKPLKSSMCNLILSDSTGIIFAYAFLETVCKQLFSLSNNIEEDKLYSLKDKKSTTQVKCYLQEFSVNISLRKEDYLGKQQVKAEVISLTPLETTSTLVKLSQLLSNFLTSKTVNEN